MCSLPPLYIVCGRQTFICILTGYLPQFVFLQNPKSTYSYECQMVGTIHPNNFSAQPATDSHTPRPRPHSGTVTGATLRKPALVCSIILRGRNFRGSCVISPKFRTDRTTNPSLFFNSTCKAIMWCAVMSQYELKKERKQQVSPNTTFF